jgi:hypothetical protein
VKLSGQNILIDTYIYIHILINTLDTYRTHPYTDTYIQIPQRAVSACVMKVCVYDKTCTYKSEYYRFHVSMCRIMTSMCRYMTEHTRNVLEWSSGIGPERTRG